MRTRVAWPLLRVFGKAIKGPVLRMQPCQPLAVASTKTNIIINIIALVLALALVFARRQLTSISTNTSTSISTNISTSTSTTSSLLLVFGK